MQAWDAVKPISFKDAMQNTGPMGSDMEDDWEVEDLFIQKDDV